MKSDQINELAAALSKAQGAMGAAQMDAKNPHFNSKYATLASIIDAARKPLADNGLAFSQMLGYGDDGIVLLDTMLMHSSGQWIASEVAIKSSPTNRGVNEVQALGSALTYYKRYALAAILGISTADEDDDGNTAQQARPARQKPEQARPQQAEARADEPPTSPQALLEMVNNRVQVPYDGVSHLFNALAKDIDGWRTWPTPKDVAAWGECYRVAIKHAEAKLQPAE